MKPLKIQPENATKLKSWLLTEVQRRLMHYRKAMEMRHALRSIRFGRNQINLPPLIREVVPQAMIPRLNLAFVMGEVVLGALASKRPRVLVVPRGEHDKESAPARQKWLQAKDQTIEWQARRPIFWKLMDNISNDGWGVLKTWWRPWLDFPERKEGQPAQQYNQDVTRFLEDKARWPIGQRTVDPLTFYPRIGEYGGGDFIESGLRPTAPTLAALGLKLEVGGKLVSVPKETPFPQWELPSGVSPTLRMHEFWNDEMMGLIVGSDVFLFENEMGVPPYTFRPGYTTGLYDPALEGLSAIYPTLTLQPWIDTFLGIMSGWALLAAIWPHYVEKAVNTTGHETLQVHSIEFGKLVELPPGWSIKPGTAPPVGTEIRDMLSTLVGFTERFTPPILQGLAPGRIAGVAASALREAALGRLSSLIDNSEQLLMENDALVLYIIDKVIGTTVYAEGWSLDEASGRRTRGERVGLGPRDIQGRYQSQRQLNTDSLQDIIAKGTHGVFMKQGGLWTEERSMRFSGVDDPIAERRQKLKEWLMDQLGPMYALQEAASEEPTLAELVQSFLGQEGGPAAESGAEGGGGGEGGGPQNIGGPAPRGGGRPTGSPKGAGGTRAVRQPRGRMTPQ